MTKTCKINEVNLLASILGSCKNEKELSDVSSLIAVIRLLKKLQKISADQAEEQKKILEAFEVPIKNNENGSMYDWSEMDTKTQTKIKDSLEKLLSTDYEVEGFNFFSEGDFVSYTKGLDNNTIAFLWDYLVK